MKKSLNENMISNYTKLYKAITKETLSLYHIDNWRVIADAIIATLKQYEQRIIRLRYGLDDNTIHSRKDTARILTINNLTSYSPCEIYFAKRVGTIELNALRKLHKIIPV